MNTIDFFVRSKKVEQKHINYIFTHFFISPSNKLIVNIINSEDDTIIANAKPDYKAIEFIFVEDVLINGVRPVLHKKKKKIANHGRFTDIVIPFDGDYTDVIGDVKLTPHGNIQFVDDDKFGKVWKTDDHSYFETDIDTKKYRTYAAWVKIDNFNQSWNTLFRGDNIQIGVRHNTLGLYMKNGSPGSVILNKHANDKWGFYCYTQQGNHVKYYYQGELVYENKNTDWDRLNTGNLILGRWRGGSQDLIGKMGPVYIDNRFYSDEDVKNLMEMSSADSTVDFKEVEYVDSFKYIDNQSQSSKKVIDVLDMFNSRFKARYKLLDDAKDMLGKEDGTPHNVAFDKAAIFDGGTMGTNKYNNGIKIPDEVLRNETEFVVSVLLKGSGIIIQTDYYGDTNKSFATGWSISTNGIFKALSRSSAKRISFSEPNKDKFHHYVIHFNHNGKATVYVDGIEVASGDVSGNIFYDGRYYAATGTNIGASYASGFKGEMRDMMIMKGSITAKEVYYLFEYYKKQAIIDSIESYYTLNNSTKDLLNKHDAHWHGNALYNADGLPVFSNSDYIQTDIKNIKGISFKCKLGSDSNNLLFCFNHLAIRKVNNRLGFTTEAWSGCGDLLGFEVDFNRNSFVDIYIDVKNLKIFVNGKEKALNKYYCSFPQKSYTTDGLTIGYGDFGSGFNGELADVAVFTGEIPELSIEWLTSNISSPKTLLAKPTVTYDELNSSINYFAKKHFSKARVLNNFNNSLMNVAALGMKSGIINGKPYFERAGIHIKGKDMIQLLDDRSAMSIMRRPHYVGIELEDIDINGDNTVLFNMGNQEKITISKGTITLYNKKYNFGPYTCSCKLTEKPGYIGILAYTDKILLIIDGTVAGVVKNSHSAYDDYPAVLGASSGTTDAIIKRVLIIDEEIDLKEALFLKKTQNKISDGLITFLPLCQNDSDISGNRFVPLWKGNKQFLNGLAYFDGKTYIDLSNQMLTKCIPQSFTISFVAKPGDFTGAACIVSIDKGKFEFELDLTNNEIIVNYHKNTQRKIKPLVDWQNSNIEYTITVDVPNKTGKTYINGQLVDTCTIDITGFDSDVLYIGAGANSSNRPNNFFQGYIGNFIVHNRALTDEEVKNLSVQRTQFLAENINPKLEKEHVVTEKYPQNAKTATYQSKKYVINNTSIELKPNTTEHYNLSFVVRTFASVDSYPSDYIAVHSNSGSAVIQIRNGEFGLVNNSTPYDIDYAKSSSDSSNLSGQNGKYNTSNEVVISVTNVDPNDTISVELHCDQSFYDEAIGYEIGSAKYTTMCDILDIPNKSIIKGEYTGLISINKVPMFVYNNVSRRNISISDKKTIKGMVYRDIRPLIDQFDVLIDDVVNALHCDKCSRNYSFNRGSVKTHYIDNSTYFRFCTYNANYCTAEGVSWDPRTCIGVRKQRLCTWHSVCSNCGGNASGNDNKNYMSWIHYYLPVTDMEV